MTTTPATMTSTALQISTHSSQKESDDGNSPEAPPPPVATDGNSASSTNLDEPSSTAPEADPFSVTVENFSEGEKDILKKAVDEVKAATKKMRPKIIKKAETQILALPENVKLERDGREALTRKTRKWLRLHARIAKPKKSLTKKWTGPSVMYHQDPKPVLEKQSELHEKGKARGKPDGAFSYFAKAKARVYKALDKEKRKWYKSVAAQWNTEGPSEEIKSK